MGLSAAVPWQYTFQLSRKVCVYDGTQGCAALCAWGFTREVQQVGLCWFVTLLLAIQSAGRSSPCVCVCVFRENQEEKWYMPNALCVCCDCTARNTLCQPVQLNLYKA